MFESWNGAILNECDSVNYVVYGIAVRIVVIIAVYFAERPSDDETHIDYVPTLFAFTTSPEQKLKLQAKVASHE